MEFPPVLHPISFVHQGVNLLHSLGQPNVHLGTYLVIVQAGFEGSYHSYRVDVCDISIDSAESLQVLS